VPARIPRAKSNPELAKPHPAGAKIHVIQTLLHKTYGALVYVQPEYFSLYREIAHESYDRSEELFTEMLRKTPVDSANCRVLGEGVDGELGNFMYHGYNLVLYSHIAVDMYTIERLIRVHNLGQTNKRDWSKIDVADRLKTILPGILGCIRPSAELMDAFGKIREVRDSIMHPKPASIYSNDQHWDKVPLAWLLSERRATCLPTMNGLIDHFEPHFARFKEKYDKGATLTGSRGMQFTHPAKPRVD
jgi:hypothetical protein